jgi:CRISPR/Cas system-associated endonuclease Cas1
MTMRGGNAKPATKPQNASARFRFGTLLISTGACDLMLGVVRHEQNGPLAFALDMMEPKRPKVVRAVLAFLESKALHPADFNHTGGRSRQARSELARAVARLTA